MDWDPDGFLQGVARRAAGIHQENHNNLDDGVEGVECVECVDVSVGASVGVVPVVVGVGGGGAHSSGSYEYSDFERGTSPFRL